MRIEIAACLKPFSHLLGTVCVVPCSSIQVEVFPTLLRFKDLVSGETWEEHLHWKGPVECFTVVLDLEKKRVHLSAQTAQGYRSREIQRKDFLPKVVERLSLGKHTELDWELVLRRMKMEEIAPVLFYLGQLVPPAEGKTPLLNFLNFTQKTEVCALLRPFFKASFHGILAPRLQDEEFQGIMEEGEVEGSPLVLLRKGYEALRGLFFREDNGWEFLPQLPPEFHAGRLVSLHTSEGDEISIEWSKKQIKKVWIKPVSTREVDLRFQKSLHRYRVNQKKVHDVKKPLLFVAGQTLFIDRFEK